MNRRKAFEFALVILVAALAATPSRAQLNFGTAQSTYVVEPKTGTSFVSNNPHWQFTGASTTKAMTMHLALKAIQSNVIGLNDTIQISKYSTTFNCNCWASAGQKAGHNLVGGELFTVDDALYGVDESFVEPTVSLAEYVANAWLNGKKATGGADQALSATLLQRFIDDLMNPEAQALGLNDTIYTSVFGAVNERTSTYDLVTLWTKSSADPLFIQHTGFRRHDGAIKVFQKGIGYVPQNYTLYKSYNYYLNVDGDKNGGFGSTCCFVSQATRGGRTLVGSILGSTTGFNDIAAALQDGFNRLFEPTRWITTAFGPPSTRVSVSSASASRAVTAHTMTDGRMALEVWGLDIPGKNLTLQGDLYSQVTGADDVAVTHVRRDFAATATSANGSVTLTGWNIDANGKPTETAPINLGAGSSPRAVTIGTNLFVVAMIMPGGTPRLSTFSISPSSPAQIFTLSEVDAPFTATEIDVAGGPALAWGGETQILLAGRKNAGGVRLHLYTVSGLIAQFTEQAHLDVADLTGVSLGRTSFYSTAYKLAGVGPAPDYEANLIFLDTAGDQIANVGSASYQRDTSTATRVAGLGFSANSATLFTLNSSGGVRVTAHDIDTRDGGALPILYNLLSDSGLPADHATALDAAQVYDSGAAGAYLVATVGSDQLVHLVAWRLGWQ